MVVKQKAAAAPVSEDFSCQLRKSNWWYLRGLCSLPTESLNELEDQDLDTLVTDLRSESTADNDNDNAADEDATSAASREDESAANFPAASTASETPKQSVNPSQNAPCFQSEPQTKADKIQFAMDKMTDGKVGGAKKQPCVLTPKVTREFSTCTFPLLCAAYRQGADERRRLQGPEGGQRPDGRRRVGGAAREDTLWRQRGLEPGRDSAPAADRWDTAGCVGARKILQAWLIDWFLGNVKQKGRRVVVLRK